MPRTPAGPVGSNPAPTPVADKLVVCADGSAGRRGGPPLAGIAWVSEDGLFGWDVVATRSPLVAELSAIRSAIDAQPPTLPLLVLSDSRPVLDLLDTRRRTGTIPLRADAYHRRAAARLIHELALELERRTVELRWVRGHSGHSLNEAADRLAVQARRCAQNGGDLRALTPLACRIVADTTPAA